MFDHPGFIKYSFEDIPLDTDIFLMEEKWLKEYENSWLKTFEGGENENVGYIGYAAARKVSATAADLSWYPNIFTRFHEVRISLPRDQFIVCVEIKDYDGKPHIFVKNEWLDHIYLRSYSVFALIDASDVKDALKNGSLMREKLILLRDRIDEISKLHTDISFISFADSLLLKSNWQVGTFDSEIKYSYKPEIFISLFLDIQRVYREVVGLNIYAVLTQGSNEFYDDPLLHISSTNNHISLNSFGLPFAQLVSIERTARTAIKNGTHRRAELYMDEDFFHSLNLLHDLKKEDCKRNNYQEPLLGESRSYFIADCNQILIA